MRKILLTAALKPNNNIITTMMINIDDNSPRTAISASARHCPCRPSTSGRMCLLEATVTRHSLPVCFANCTSWVTRPLRRTKTNRTARTPWDKASRTDSAKLSCGVRDGTKSPLTRRNNRNRPSWIPSNSSCPLFRRCCKPWRMNTTRMIHHPNLPRHPKHHHC